MTIPRHLPPGLLLVAAQAWLLGPPWPLDACMLAYAVSGIWWVAVSTRPAGSFWRSLAVLWVPTVPGLVYLGLAVRSVNQSDLAWIALWGALMVVGPLVAVSAAGSVVLAARTAETRRIRSPVAAGPSAGAG